MSEEEEEKDRRERVDFALARAMRQWLKARYNLEFEDWGEIIRLQKFLAAKVELLPVDEWDPPSEFLEKYPAEQRKAIKQYYREYHIWYKARYLRKRSWKLIKGEKEEG